MPVEIVCHARSTLRRAELERRIDRLLSALRREAWAVCVLLTDDAEMKRLNRRFRGKNRPTDVLSFPSIARPPAPRGRSHARYLGDLVISIDTARRQAKVLRHGLLAEVTVLIAHGLLHLCGYDHEQGEAEARRMLRRERALLRAVGIERDPLTFRRV
jgi:rRNA maturation RNase YbeY